MVAPLSFEPQQHDGPALSVRSDADPASPPDHAFQGSSRRDYPAFVTRRLATHPRSLHSLLEICSVCTPPPHVFARTGVSWRPAS